jgi:hypothetical protein
MANNFEMPSDDDLEAAHQRLIKEEQTNKWDQERARNLNGSQFDPVLNHLKGLEHLKTMNQIGDSFAVNIGNHIRMNPELLAHKNAPEFLPKSLDHVDLAQQYLRQSYDNHKLGDYNEASQNMLMAHHQLSFAANYAKASFGNHPINDVIDKHIELSKETANSYKRMMSE